MKLPFIDIHIVRGKKVVTSCQLKAMEEKEYVRTKVTANLLDKINHLKDLLKGRQ